MDREVDQIEESRDRRNDMALRSSSLRSAGISAGRSGSTPGLGRKPTDVAKAYTYSSADIPSTRSDVSRFSTRTLPLPY